MRAHVRPLVLALLVVTALSTTTGCIRLPSPLGPDGSGGMTILPDDAEGLPATPDDESADPGAGADPDSAFAEREQFFEDQQLPLDGTPLVAVTPAQKEFIAEQKAYVEEQGATWTAQEENISLALAADACETAILNYHEVDATTMQAHVATSPLFARLIPSSLTGADRTAAEQPIASLMVFGATFLCPDDGDAWVAAYQEVYGG